MKNIIIAMLMVNLVFLESCKDSEETPQIMIEPIYNIRSDFGSGLSKVVMTGNCNTLKEGGACWSKTPNPTINDNKIVVDVGRDCRIYYELKDMDAATQYFVRAYIVYENKVVYSNEVSFTTLVEATQLPEVTTLPAEGIAAESAYARGKYEIEPGTGILEKGFCSCLENDPGIYGCENGTSNLDVNVQETNFFYTQFLILRPETVYCVKAFATNSVGTAYGEEISFKTTSQ